MPKIIRAADLVIAPLAWLCLCKFVLGEFFYTFSNSARVSHAEIMAGRFSFDPRLWSWLAVLWRSSGPSFVVGGLIGIMTAFVFGRKRQLSAFFLVPLAAFTVNTVMGRMAGMGARTVSDYNDFAKNKKH